MQEALDLVYRFGDRGVHLVANPVGLVFLGRPFDGRVLARGRVEDLVGHGASSPRITRTTRTSSLLTVSATQRVSSSMKALG